MEKITIPQAESRSADLVKENLEQLKQIFPEVIKEGRVDLDALHDLLGSYSDTAEERFGLNWAGKANARREAQKRSTGTLRPCPEESMYWDTTENLYIEGDNLEVLKLLQKSYHKQVKMIYIDPPYNTGKDFVYKDNYNDNLANYLEQTGQDRRLSTKALSDSDGRYHSNWLNMMYPRLKLARNLLTDDGVIFISIGVEELSNLKSLCNELFGEENFVEVFSWVKTSTPPALSAKSRKTNEYILCYEKNKSKNKYNGDLLDGGDQPLLNTGNTLRILKFQKDKVRFNASKFPDGIYEPYCKDRVKLLDKIEIINGYANKDFRLEGEFKWTQDFLDNEIIAGTTFVVKSELLSIRFIRDEDGYKRPTNFIKEKYTSPIIDKPTCNVGTNENASSSLNILMDNVDVFSYPKPISLLKYLTNFICQPRDIVLDFFSGSASTAEAIFEYNCENNNTGLKFIMVQLPENLDENLKVATEPDTKKIIQNGIDFLDIYHKPHLLTELAKERIRRAGKKILEEQIAKNDGLCPEEAPKLDVGFKVFKLDSSNVNAWDSNPENLETTLINSLFNIKEDRTEDDLLYEILIKYGIVLTEKINRHTIAGKTVYEMGAGSLIVCLADNITTDVAEGIGKLWNEVRPEEENVKCRMVFKDSGFNGSDEMKTNTMLILKQHGITNLASV